MASGLTAKAQLLAQDDKIAHLQHELSEIQREMRDLRGAVLWYRYRPGSGPWEGLDEDAHEQWRLMAERFGS